MLAPPEPPPLPAPPLPAAAPPEPDPEAEAPEPDEDEPEPPEPEAPEPEAPDDAPEPPDAVLDVVVDVVAVLAAGEAGATVPVGTVNAGAPEVSAWLEPPPPQAARPSANVAPITRAASETAA